ncbi:MAG: alpha/beta fold hydrolase [Rhizomicrobium sp.]
MRLKRLVLIHGWGFGPAVWDALCTELTGVETLRLDLGFFAQPVGDACAQAVQKFAPSGDDILVGHSLGLLWGLTQYAGWGGFIAINGFARFAARDGDPNCAPVAALKAMKMGLRRDPEKVVADFYHALGHDGPVPRGPNAAALSTGLDLLIKGDLVQTDLPGLILAGRDDPLVSVAASEHLAAIAPHADLVWTKGGHLLPLTHAKDCAQHIHIWMARCG